MWSERGQNFEAQIGADFSWLSRPPEPGVSEASKTGATRDCFEFSKDIAGLAFSLALRGSTVAAAAAAVLPHI